MKRSSSDEPRLVFEPYSTIEPVHRERLKIQWFAVTATVVATAVKVKLGIGFAYKNAKKSIAKTIRSLYELDLNKRGLM
jgi:hypothetical protein